MDSEIIVQGTGQAFSMPDRAVIDVRVDAEGATKERAYDVAATLAKQVDDVLANRAGAVNRMITAVVRVDEKSRYRKGEYVRTGWQAGRRTRVEVTDFGQLGELIAELTDAGAAVSGPAWRLDVSNPVHGEARRLAAEDARTRAQDYAAGLGLTIGSVAWVSEPGLRGRGDGEGFGGHFTVASAVAAVPEEEEVIDVTPDEMTASAAVEVGFRLSSPA